MSGLVSSCVCTPVLSVAELLSSGVYFVRPIGCLGCLEGLFWLPSPRGVAEGVERRGITAGVKSLGLGLMPAPVQLAGEGKSCVLVVPVASQCHNNRLGCCSSSSSWAFSHLSLVCISSRTFFPPVWVNHGSGR